MLRDAMLEKARKQIERQPGALCGEIAEHKRDPYSLVEEIVRAQNAHRFDGGTGVPPSSRRDARRSTGKIVSQWKVIYGIQH